jgi:hypothetical protein
MVYVATSDTDEQQAPTANSDCVNGSLSYLCGSTQIESAAPTTTSDRKYTGIRSGDYLMQCDRACGTLSDLCGSTQIESAAPTTTSDRENTGIKPGDYGWIGQQSSSGFINLAPSILHYDWF